MRSRSSRLSRRERRWPDRLAFQAAEIALFERTPRHSPLPRSSEMNQQGANCPLLGYCMWASAAPGASQAVTAPSFVTAARRRPSGLNCTVVTIMRGVGSWRTS
jgi:hypothetical protein